MVRCFIGSSGLIALWLALFSSLGPTSSAQVAELVPTNALIRTVAANLSSGTSQAYEAPGIRILQGLKPDVVAIQEFNYGNNSPTAIRSFVDTTFDTSFHYFRESAAGYTIPNGIISRWPILASGSWEDVDSGVNDRGFAWAQLDIPGTNDLFVVSIHLKASNNYSDKARRAAQATNLVNLIANNLPANAWTIVAGDCNIYDSSELAYLHLAGRFSDQPMPSDAPVGGDPDTNAGRTERYDYVFFSSNLAALQTNTVFPSQTFPRGLVFDSRVYSPLSDVSPVLASDSAAAGMQHMAVVRSFAVPLVATNFINPPLIIAQPQSLEVHQGASAGLTVSAQGTLPLHYQWRLSNIDLPGATANRFTIPNMQPDNQGSYSVLVSNRAGTTLSSDARLTLSVPQPHVAISSSSVIHWQGLSNLVYRVESTPEMPPKNWITVGTVSSAIGKLLFTNTVPSAQGFLRVVYP